MILLLTLGCTDVPLEVELTQAGNNRDLVASTTRRASFEWYREGAVVDGLEADRVRARELESGTTWTVVATARDGEQAEASLTIPEPPGGNVLVLLLDDVGVDKLAAFDGPYAPSTPVLDSLAAQGTRFTRAYSAPVCSPTRGVLMTGRHGRRHNLGWIVDTGNRTGQLPLSTTTIPEALPDHWSNAALGKWHLAGPNVEGYLDHPNDSGFDHFAGAPGNPDYREGRGYYDWTKNTNGTVSTSTTYMTVDTVDDALEQIRTLPEPWFVYVAFNAVHGPLNLPPPELLPAGVTVTADSPKHEIYDAILQVLDAEIGRLVDNVDPDVLARTTMITVGDNGTMANGLPDEADRHRVKHTLYEGGVHVPFIVNGPLVTEPGSSSSALVHVADIFPTAMEIAGVPLEGPEGAMLVLDDDEVELDGRSLVPLLADTERHGRATVYTELFLPNGVTNPNRWNRTVIGQTHKLIRFNGGREELYRIDPVTGLDTVDLLEDPDALGGQDAEQLATLRSSLDVMETRVLGSTDP